MSGQTQQFISSSKETSMTLNPVQLLLMTCRSVKSLYAVLYFNLAKMRTNTTDGTSGSHIPHMLFCNLRLCCSLRRCCKTSGSVQPQAVFATSGNAATSGGVAASGNVATRQCCSLRQCYNLRQCLHTVASAEELHGRAINTTRLQPNMYHQVWQQASVHLQ